jgi:hypothetical protein
MRLTLDGDKVLEIRERHEALARAQVLAARGIVRRGIRRGELPSTTSVTVVLDTLVGGAMMHALSAPAHLREKVVTGADVYAEQLVDFVLGSASATR